MSDHEFLAPKPGSGMGGNASSTSLQTGRTPSSVEHTRKGTQGSNNIQAAPGGAIPKINITFKAPLPNNSQNPINNPTLNIQSTNIKHLQIPAPENTLQRPPQSLVMVPISSQQQGQHRPPMNVQLQMQMMQQQQLSAGSSQSSNGTLGLAMNRPIAPMRPPYQAQQQQFMQGDLIRSLLSKKQMGTATPQELEVLQKYMIQFQQQQQMQQSRPPIPSSIHQQAHLIQQQQLSVQQKMAMAQVQARQTQGRPGASRQPQISQTQMMTRPTLLPAQNTYGPRIQKGGTSLVVNVAVPEPSRAQTRRGRFTEDSLSDEEETSESEVTDSEDEDQLARRQARKELRLAKQKDKVPEITHVAPFIPRKRTRLLLTTRHEYDKMHIYQVDHIARSQEVLVPISIELDIDSSYKFQDSFSWNLNEPAMTPEKFAEFICVDLNLSPHPHQGAIARSIRAQLEDYKKYFLYSDAPIPQDTRTIIKLDITVGKVQLRDRFEWDMSSGLTPEDFAAILVSDLHLGGEFVSLIAHSIREQLYKVKSSGEFDPSFPIEKPFRSEEEARSWSPYIDCGEIEGEEGLSIEEDRKQRLLRRQLRVNSSARGRGYVQRGYLIHDENSSSMPFIVGASHPTQGALSPEEKAIWRCSHCYCSFSQTPSIFTGPKGENTLCRSCGLYYEEGQSLPDHRIALFRV